MSRTVCIYLLLDEEGLPVYVGKTINPARRLSAHRGARSYRVSMLILESCSPAAWPERETARIAYFRRLGFPLENKNNGGGGPLFVTIPRPVSQAARDKISLSLTGRPKPPRTEEHSTAISRALQGKRLSDATRESMSKAALGRDMSQVRWKSKADWRSA